MIPSRRGFLFGAGAAIVAAPAIVRVAANLMPVSTRALTDGDWLTALWHKYERRKLEFIEKLARPPMIATPTLKNEPASIMTGWITYASTPLQAASFRPLFEIMPQSMQRRLA